MDPPTNFTHDVTAMLFNCALCSCSNPGCQLVFVSGFYSCVRFFAKLRVSRLSMKVAVVLLQIDRELCSNQL